MNSIRAKNTRIMYMLHFKKLLICSWRCKEQFPHQPDYLPTLLTSWCRAVSQNLPVCQACWLRWRGVCESTPFHRCLSTVLPIVFKRNYERRIGCKDLAAEKSAFSTLRNEDHTPLSAEPPGLRGIYPKARLALRSSHRRSKRSSDPCWNIARKIPSPTGDFKWSKLLNTHLTFGEWQSPPGNDPTFTISSRPRSYVAFIVSLSKRCNLGGESPLREV